MDVIEPPSPAPALLLLGKAEDTKRLLFGLCEEIGVLFDEARGREEALAKFLERGGHELVVVLDHDDPGLLETIVSLMEVDPGLMWFDLTGHLDEDAWDRLEAHLVRF